MAVIEREYNIPLRREFQKVPIYKKSKKASTAVREFLVKHMKSENIKIGNHLNEKIWENGIRNPPHHVLVKVTKNEDGSVFAELKEKPVTRKSSIEKKRDKKEMKMEKSKSVADRVKETVQKKDSSEQAGKKEASKETSSEKPKETSAKKPSKEEKTKDSETMKKSSSQKE
ncbi:MAG: 50S ribosomal protein L31e [Candidatus Woesearchaeota archaeon]